MRRGVAGIAFCALLVAQAVAQVITEPGPLAQFDDEEEDLNDHPGLLVNGRPIQHSVVKVRKPKKSWGAFPIDAFSYPDIIDGTRPVLLKVDKDFSGVSDENDDWAYFTRAAATCCSDPTFMVAELGIEGRGDDKYNEKLRDSLGVRPDGGSLYDSYPALRLFIPGKELPIRYKGGLDSKKITLWIREQTGIRIGLNGTIPEFEQLTETFMSEESKMKETLDTAKAKAKEYKGDKEKKELAQYYVSVMKKIYARKTGSSEIPGCGDRESIVACEKKRVTKLSKRPPGTMAELKARRKGGGRKRIYHWMLNILVSFEDPEETVAEVAEPVAEEHRQEEKGDDDDEEDTTVHDEEL